MYRNTYVLKLKHLILLVILIISSFNFIFINDLSSNNQPKTDSKTDLKSTKTSESASNNLRLDNSKIIKNTQKGKELSLKTDSLNSAQSISSYSTGTFFTITNNNQFATNGFTGSGTQANPYILQNFDFNDQNYIQTIIKISNTTVYFQIKSNKFETNGPSGSYYPFIDLTNVTNAVISNNNFLHGNQAVRVTGSKSDSINITYNTMNNDATPLDLTGTNGSILISGNNISTPLSYGIKLTTMQNTNIVNNTITNSPRSAIYLTGNSAKGVTLANNTIINNQQGIGAGGLPGYITVYNNTVENNWAGGISLAGKNNIVENNTISNNSRYGLDFTGLNNATIKNNILTNNYVHIDTSIYNFNYTQNNVSNNFVNNLPVDWIQSTNNPTFSSNPAEIIVIGSTNVTIRNLPVISGPIIISYSSIISISNMTVNNSLYTGFDLYYDNNVTVINNSILNVQGHGIEVKDVGTWTNATIKDNLITSLGVCPVLLYCNGLDLTHLGDYSSFSNNTIKNFQIGISFSNSNNQLIHNNSITNSSSYGIYSSSSNNATITGNSIEANNSYAIYYQSGTFYEVTNNSFFNSSVDISTFLTFKFQNNSYDNKPIVIFDGLQNQSLFPNGTIPTVYGQVLFNNAQFIDMKDLTVLYDASFYNSNNITFDNISVLYHGVKFYNAQNITIQNNHIGSSTAYGLSISTATSFGNVIIKNNLITGTNNPTMIGISLGGGNNVLIENNIVKYFANGILLSQSSNCIVRNNTLLQSDGPSFGGSDGIQLTYSSSYNNIITNNTIKYFYTGIYLDYKIIYFNEFSSNLISYSYDGIRLSQSLNSSIKNNVFSFNSYGVYLTSSNYNNFTNNIFANSTWANIYLSSSSFNNFTSNIIKNGQVLQNVELVSNSVNNTFLSNNFTNNDFWMHFDSTSGNNTVKNNIFLNTLYVALKIESADNLITNNDFIGNNWTNTNNPPGKQIQVTNANNVVLGNYYSDHSNLDFNWDDIADSPYTNFGSSLNDSYPKLRPIFMPDVIAPKLFILPGNNTVFNATGFILSYNISERSINRIFINGFPNGTLLVSGTNMSYLGDGTYNITIESTDLAGNVATIQISVIIDTIPPQILFINPVNTTYTNTNINVSYTIVEKSNYSLAVYINGVQNNTVTNNTFWTFKQGLNNITFYAVDQIGNEATVSIYFTVDSLPPALTVYSPLNTTYYVSPVLFNYSISDVSSYSVIIYINNIPNSSAINPGTELNFTNGYYNITFFIMDAFNHNTTYSFYFTVDLLPVVNIYTLANTSYNTNNLMINYTYSGAISANFTIDGFANSSVILNGTMIHFFDGYHNITIYGFDSIGRNSSKTYIFLIDTIAPEITITSPTSTAYTTTTIIINYQIMENNSYTTIIYINNNANTSNIISGSNLNLKEGDNNVTIFVIDSAGNSVSKTILLTINTSSTTTPASNTTSSSTSSSTFISKTSFKSNTTSSLVTQTSPLSIMIILYTFILISSIRLLIVRRKKFDK